MPLPTVFKLLAISVLQASAAHLPFDRSVMAMGTLLQIHLVGDSAQTARVSEEAVKEVERIEAACSTWRAQSKWSRLNQAQGKPVQLEREWLVLLQTALDWQRRTQGAFDPVLGKLMEAWGIRSKGRIPSPQELARARLNSGASLLVIDAASGTAQLKSPTAAVEEGAFVKGYALDKALEKISVSGIDSGWLNFGGQVLAWGKPLSVDIAGPDNRNQAAYRVVIAQASLSSSGTSEHGRHIIDPATGRPAPGWGSVAVVMPDGLTADVLSTALYVMGATHGMAWANAHRVAALFQSNHSSTLMSDAFRALNPQATRKSP